MSVLASFHVGPLSWLNWNLKALVLRRVKNQRTWRKTVRARQEPTTKLT